MEILFVLESRQHASGKTGPLLVQWHPNSQIVAATVTQRAAPGSGSGLARGVQVYNVHGKVLGNLRLPMSTACFALEWDCTGEVLAMLQVGSPYVTLWYLRSKHMEQVAVDKPNDPSSSSGDITFIKWARTTLQLAIGFSKGEVVVYDLAFKSKVHTKAKNRKRVVGGDWSMAGHFAFASEDRQISICTSDGSIFGQVRVKSKPSTVKFGGNVRGGRQNIVSVSMDKKTILLYNLDDPENALELAFQSRYGYIVNFQWLAHGYIMVGFSLGYVVVISTHLDEIGREQFCHRFFKDCLRDLAYCPVRHQVAICNDRWMKIVDVDTWTETYFDEIDRRLGSGCRIQWTRDGKHLSLCSRPGYLAVFSMGTHPRMRPEEPPEDPVWRPWARLSKPMSGRFCMLSVTFALLMILFICAAGWRISVLHLLAVLFFDTPSL